MSLIFIIMMTVGVQLIFSSRTLTKKYFTEQDQNKSTFVIKAIGTLVCVASLLLFIIFVK